MQHSATKRFTQRYVGNFQRPKEHSVTYCSGLAPCLFGRRTAQGCAPGMSSQQYHLLFATTHFFLKFIFSVAEHNYLDIFKAVPSVRR